MSITTKNGDGGMTTLIKTKNVPKCDERIQLLGNMDELTSHLGLVKSSVCVPEVKAFLNDIQNTLITVMAGIAEPHNIKYHLKESEVKKLEEEMERMTGLFSMPEGWILPGANPLSAQTDIARTVARRCERHLSSVTIKYGSDKMTKQYVNRLSDYLFTLARYLETACVPGKAEEVPACQEQRPGAGEETQKIQESEMKTMENSKVNDAIIQEVLKRIGKPERITLETVKKLIDKVEAYAQNKGKTAVIAVCGPDGNPIAVHVMDDAFLVSFDVALKKAYTSAAVKMSTMELGKLIQPGATFQGLDKIQGDKMVFFGGGVPLMSGDKLLGALGVSGGTGEEDHDIAEYGLRVFEELAQ